MTPGHWLTGLWVIPLRRLTGPYLPPLCRPQESKAKDREVSESWTDDWLLFLIPYLPLFVASSHCLQESKAKDREVSPSVGLIDND